MGKKTFVVTVTSDNAEDLAKFGRGHVDEAMFNSAGFTFLDVDYKVTEVTEEALTALDELDSE